MKTSTAEKLARSVFGDRIPNCFYSALKDLDTADNDLRSAMREHTVQAYHYNNLDAAKSHLFDLLSDDGAIVIGRVTNRYEEGK